MAVGVLVEVDSQGKIVPVKRSGTGVIAYTQSPGLIAYTTNRSLALVSQPVAKGVVISTSLIRGTDAGLGGYLETPPTSETAPGEPGQYAIDANYFYACFAPNQWIAIAKSPFPVAITWFPYRLSGWMF